MSIMQRLTLIGLYNYDSKLFDALQLPEEYDKNTFIESLLIEHGEKLVLYSDLDFMKYSIGAWGRKWSMELTRIAEALQAEYNPIWNYDRYEEWNDKGSKRGTSETDSSSDLKTNGSTSRINQSNVDNNSTSMAEGDSSHRLKNTPDYQEKTTNESITNAEVEHQVSADNSSTYQPESKDITNAGKQEMTMKATGAKDDISERNTSDTKTTEAGNIKTNESGRDVSDSSSSGSNKEKKADSEINNSDHIGHLWGNIGVTTSAAMVTEAVEQRMKYNLYNAACRLFANELLIGIY